MQTNADKYNLTKEQIKEIAQEIDIIYQNDENVANAEQATIVFFNKPVKTTLTDDEKAILRNIDKKIKYITRDKSGYLYITQQPFSMLALPFSIYNHLFQFIKNGEEYEIKELLKDE